MMISTPSKVKTMTRFLAFSLVALVACGDDDVRLDASTDAPMADGGTDAGSDTIAPTFATDPTNGEEDVEITRAFVVSFSEPMDEAVGTIEASVEGEAVALVDRTFSSDGTELVARFSWPANATVSVRLEGFADVAGNAAPDATVSFTTVDTTPPVAVESTPEEGSTVVLPGELLVRFSEPMNVAVGTVSLIGGPGTIGAPTWAADSFTVTLSGLAYDTDYSIVLMGFADVAGNAFDGVPYLSDGAVDFTTGPDTDAPSVTASSPSEGQVEVTIGTQVIVVDFSEPMASAGTIAITSDAGMSASGIAPSWSRGATRATFSVPDLLDVEAAYEVDFDGFTDVAGNALDGAPYLGDGVLDFVTGEDLFPPYVLATTPEENATDVPFGTNRIVVAFSEAMDTSRTTATLESSSLGDFELTGVWIGDTVLELDVRNVLVSGQSYRLDLSAFTDAGGAMLRTDHPYLGDGVLELATVIPRGESCPDAFDVERASVEGARHTWTWAARSVVGIDGGGAFCDSNGSTSPDGVIRFRKTSADTVLHVVARGLVSGDQLNVEVMRGACDPTADTAEAARVRCMSRRNRHELFVPGAPGDYFVWVSDVGTLFDGAEVSITEIASPPEGESCDAPFAVGSRFYTAPTEAGGFHVWQIPEDSIVSHDRSVSGRESFLCDDNALVGNDAVLAFPKATDTSIVQVQIETTGDDLVVDLLGACDAAADSGLCEDTVTGARTYELFGAAGPRHVWIADDNEGSASFPTLPDVFGPAVTIRVREIEPTPGGSCATAIPITPGATVPVTPNNPQRIGVPSCFGTGGITWYRYTASQRLAFVSTNGIGGASFASSPSGTELGCSAEASSTSAWAFTTIGNEVCVGVASNPAITAIALEEVQYAGVTGASEVDLNVTPPEGSGGILGAFYGLDFLVTSPTRIFLGVTDDVFSAPIGGGPATLLGSDTRYVGNGATTVGEALFSVDSLTTAGVVRVWRLTDDSGVWSPTAWDTDFTWPNTARVDAIAYDGTRLIAGTNGSSPTFYAIDPATPGAITTLGINDSLGDVSGLAADAEWVYVAGSLGGAEGIYRVRNADLGTPGAPVEILFENGAVNMSNDQAHLGLQPASPAGPAVLYFRGYGPPHTYAVIDPGGTTPRVIGPIDRRGDNNEDFNFAYDATNTALILADDSTPASERTLWQVR